MAGKAAQRRGSGQDELGGGGVVGQGPFDKGIQQTPRRLWTAVVLMCLGAAVLGLGVVVLSMSMSTGVVVLVAGGVIGAVGAGVAATNGIMSNVE